MKKKIAVIGAGSWGTALAKVVVENGHDVWLWGHRATQIEEINQRHQNTHYLPGIDLPIDLKATTDLATAVAEAEIILVVIPTKAIRSVMAELKDYLKAPVCFVHASKGLEQGTHKRISEIIAEEIPAELRTAVAVLSGPSHAEEVARKDITTVTVAAAEPNACALIQQVFMNQYFRIYTNDDIIGVETGAALKNIIALGAGAIHGLGYGDNATAAILTRGLAEITRLGVAMGANPLTFIGLSGVGDLVVTCTSVHSRNWRAGDLLGQGKQLEVVLAEMGMVVEGVSTTKAAYELAGQLNVEMPITATIYRVLYEGAEVKSAVTQLMLRDGKSEKEYE